jgi:hypothetical protein
MDLSKIILKNTKPSFKAKTNDNGKPYNIISNKGIKAGQLAIKTKNGEYNGFSVRILEDVKPLLTDIRVSKAVKFIANGDISSAVAVLNINNEVNKYGIDIVYTVIKIWLEKNGIDVPTEFIDNSIEIDDNKLLKWILTTRSDPIDASLEIVGIGQSKKGNTVVPESWIGKKFNNAYELHNEMDNLDWRKGKPPTSFCCIYSMGIEDNLKWKKKIDVNIKNIDILVHVDVNKNKINTTIIKKQKNNIIDFLNNSDCYDILVTSTFSNNTLAICTKVNKISNTSPIYEKTDNIGLLVSMLQKSIRHGQKCSKMLSDTIIKLSKAPHYNLPEHKFVRVSGSRQLTWRLLITIIEDAQPYIEDNDNEYLSIADLVALALISQNDPDIQLNINIINKILYTALLVQHNDSMGSCWAWRKGSIGKELKYCENMNKKNGIINALNVALESMPMMDGDKKMLNKSIDYINEFKLTKLPKLQINELMLSNNKKYIDAYVASYDMHCIPNILLMLQASFPFIPYKDDHKTSNLSSFIWNTSSRINIRYNCSCKLDNEMNKVYEILKEIQMDMYEKNIKKYNLKNIFGKNNINTTINNKNLLSTDNISRIGFLLLFGNKHTVEYNKKKYDIYLIGDSNQVCKVKKNTKTSKFEFIEGVERFMCEIELVNKLNNITINTPNPPNGYKWIWGDKKKIILSAKLLLSDKNKMFNSIIFYADGYPIYPFDASNILVPINIVNAVDTNKEFSNIISQALYINENYNYSHYEINNLLKNIAIERLKLDNITVYDWYKIAKKSKLPNKVWKILLVKIINANNGSILIGPVSRTGDKLNEPVDYLYEGTVMRLLNMLSALYPKLIKETGVCKYYINTNDITYNHLFENINKLSFTESNNNNNEKKEHPIITTNLWYHQKQTRDRIIDGIFLFNKKGFGDASNVGSGKTLTILSVFSEILGHKLNISSNENNKYYGFLVLLPTTNLYKTWHDEITKHTKGFNILMQNANGTLSSVDGGKKKTVDNINSNTIIITTLGRMRDHPLSHPWKMVAIDECLSVQNNDALQTSEAWRQVICSQYGVIMASATFFRSRFDKLFYMLKMLRSGLPENKEYLDCILNECIICNIPENSRKWNININRYELPKSMRTKYDSILKSFDGVSSEKIYNILASYLFNNFDYIDIFHQTIKKVEGVNGRCLIYARSKDEANIIANQIDNVSRFPDVSGKHVVVSYTEGTYGLNNLVHLDTIVTRPCEPDKIPQMKGRLDRHLQKKDILTLEYVLIKNTIEEASLIKLELANKFYGNYIMPLAEFYDLAVGKN